MERKVAAFTDTYLPTINGVTYTVASWKERWNARGGSMNVVYPKADGYVPESHEYPVRSLPFPFYDGYRLGQPTVPDAVDDADVVHAHTPYGLGLAGYRLSRRTGAPLVATYHTPTGEYAGYVSPVAHLERLVERAARRYERWFFDATEAVVAPSEATKDLLEGTIGIETPVTVVSNGIDVERFRPVDSQKFRRARGINTDRPLVGYTGRHGYEKNLVELIDAVAGMDVTLAMAGDGPARDELERRADRLGIDAHFFGFLDREELPSFYSTLDVFGFPSPVETQGLVALEATACGTPVVGVDAGALAESVIDGETGYRYPAGDIAAFRDAIQRALAERDRLAEGCLARRESLSVDRSIDALHTLYENVST